MCCGDHVCSCSSSTIGETIAPASFEALTFARSLGDVVALTIGAAADALAPQLGDYGATEVHQAHHELLDDYNPEAWGDVLAGAVRFVAPDCDAGDGHRRRQRGARPRRRRARRADGGQLPHRGVDGSAARSPGALGWIADRDRRGRTPACVCSPSPTTPSRPFPLSRLRAATPRPFDAELDPGVARCAVSSGSSGPPG